LEVGGRVRARRRADVAALAVGDHEQPRAARVPAHLGERAHPRGSERLEEGELRLHRDRVRRDGVDDPAAEALDVAAELDRQELWPGVEADDELAALALDLGGEPVAEGERRDGHPPRRVVTADDRGPRGAALRCRSKPPASALERGLQLAAGAELRDGRGGDLNALPGARVHALTRGAVGRRELAEAREVDRVAALQRLGHGLHEGVDGLARVAVRQAALRRDLVDEILLRQSLPPRWGRRLLETSSKEANNGVGYRLTMRFCGNFPQVRGGQERPEADGGAG